MRKIYDCFIFFNELELLELRLNILDTYVDYFVICEASITHSGIPKTFFFEDNKDLFSKFLHKIIHIKITDIPKDFTNLITPDITTADGKCVEEIHGFIRNTKLFNVNDITHYGYGRDFFQKESLRRGLINCNDDDIIILSDCDEIPNPKVIETIDTFINNETFFTFNQNEYYYYLNSLKGYNWKGSRLGLYKNLKKYSFNELRAQNNTDIPNGGWHFSYMGGYERVKTKIQSYSHTEMNIPSIINNINYYISNQIDPFYFDILNSTQLIKVEIDDTYPKYLINNLNKYIHMIKNK